VLASSNRFRCNGIRHGWLRRPCVQVVLTTVPGIVLPLTVLTGSYVLDVDLASPAFLLVLCCLVITALAIWAEGIHALEPTRPPRRPAAPYPAASAVVVAYLPNEAATIVSTLRAFLHQDYPGDLQVLLAYNSPRRLPVEDELRDLAAAHPWLTLLKVPYSTSKAENINAALPSVAGRFVGIFDADHRPAPDAFRRAWHWLSHGADVVQGHCVIRNGGDSPVARTVAVEFESMYAVSHTGRAKLHGFALFGGSNGFWRTQALQTTRMHRSMLTEDIDSSIRALYAGRRLVFDPHLLSRELAPVTLRALWHQRLRWAQGWFQVSRKHLAEGLRSPSLSLRNKLGLLFLLGWREVHPWLSLQMYPVMAFLVWRAGGPAGVDWLVPTFLLTSLYTGSVGPSQTLFAWRMAAPELRRRPGWFLRYLVVSVLYAEWKNVVARVAHLKELTGQDSWVVTPRQAHGAPVEVPADGT
jgi:cellulose synthase/poly-beta-1,6-N-acetylglucosamine synthase-like glycosyltransferase